MFNVCSIFSVAHQTLNVDGAKPMVFAICEQMQPSVLQIWKLSNVPAFVKPCQIVKVVLSMESDIELKNQCQKS